MLFVSKCPIVAFRHHGRCNFDADQCVYRESGSWDTSTFDQESCLGSRDMTDAYAAPEDRIVLDTIVARLNVERFSKMYSEEADETKRQLLAHLITEEKAKLNALFSRTFA
jgi:hypothetical protein